MYANEHEMLTALSLGFNISEDRQVGNRFWKGARYVWAVYTRSLDAGGPQWQTADLVDGHYTGHQKYDSLVDALKREVN